MVKLLNLHDQWTETELVNTVSERQRVSDLLRNEPDLLDMLALR
jgi:hypothetical protein